MLHAIFIVQNNNGMMLLSRASSGFQYYYTDRDYYTMDSPFKDLIRFTKHFSYNMFASLITEHTVPLPLLDLQCLQS